MCLPELNLCNSTAEEEYKIKGYIQVHAESVLDAVEGYGQSKEDLEDCQVQMKRACNWLKDYLELTNEQKLSTEGIDLLKSSLSQIKQD